jgi:hypothetical protein
MRLPRMTTRRWMAAVVVVAMVAAALIEVERSWEQHSRYASALRAFQANQVYYEEGRATMERCVERSRRLLEAELALGGTKRAQVAAIEAHLARASSLIDEEINRPWGLHDTDYERAPEIAAAKESLVEWRARLNNLVHTR